MFCNLQICNSQQSPRQALQEDTQLPQTSVHIPNVADEAVFKEWDDRVMRATTTAASLDAAQASGNITKTQSKAMSNDPLFQEIGSGVNTLGSDEERIGQQDLMDNVPPTPHDSPLSGGYTPRSDEGRPKINELMAICTNLSNRVLALENSKTAQDLVIQKLKKRVKRLEKALRERTPGMKLFKIGTSRKKGLDKEDASKQGSKSDKIKPMFNVSDFDVLVDMIKNVEDEMTTIADTLVVIRNARPRTTSVVIRNIEEEPRRATPVPTVQSQDKEKVQFEREQRIAKEKAAEQEAKDAALIDQMEDVQARIDADALLATRLQEQEREQFSIDEQAIFLVETIVERKRFFASQRAAEIRNRPPTRTQLRNQMITYLKHMGKYTHNQLKNKSFEEIQKLYKKEQQWINDFVPMDSEERGKKRQRIDFDDENVKRQKIGEPSDSSKEQSIEKEKELSEEEL
ncbi:hypothetical protein Tco_0989827 [Tanacetum coccineum]|uniref:Uncharacterized protein n=1 Tax=Tanacetum coccineum TaxID=301880 RepID=A0ABQ5EVC9_9ASTR